METKSYEHLEGKIIDWRSPLYKEGKIFKVKVAGIDPDIGITLVNAEDPEDFFTCVNGPMSPQSRGKSASAFANWEEEFNQRLEAIEAGLYDMEKLFGERLRDYFDGGDAPGPNHCSFL